MTKTSTATIKNRRGNTVSTVEEAKVNADIRTTLKKLVREQRTNTGRYSIKDMLLAGFTVSVCWLLTWTWYFAVS